MLTIPIPVYSKSERPHLLERDLDNIDHYVDIVEVVKNGRWSHGEFKRDVRTPKVKGAAQNGRVYLRGI